MRFFCSRRSQASHILLLFCVTIGTACLPSVSDSSPEAASDAAGPDRTGRGVEAVPGADLPTNVDSLPSAPGDAARPTALLRFASVADEWGVRFADRPIDPGHYDDHMIVGSGCAICDVDGDGDLDVLIPATVDTSASAAATSSGAAARRFGFFRQVQPGHFVDDTVAAGLSACPGATGVAMGDANNDGFPDMLLTASTGISLWMNDGTGAFAEQTVPAGLQHSAWTIAATWFDYDRDGWLDLFVTNYLNHTPQSCTSLGGGKQDFCSPLLFDPTVDRLYRNLGGDANGVAPTGKANIRFRDVTSESGIGAQTTAGMQVLAADLTQDGWPDLYVASDQRPNRFWINQRDGTFTEEAAFRGCDVDFLGRPQASMGIALGAPGNRRDSGILVSHLSGEFHAFYTPAGQAYVDDCRASHLGELTRPFTGFGVAICDLNSDGLAEVITVNGRVVRPDGMAQDAADFWRPYREPLQLLQWSDGVFQDVRVEPFGSRHVARGLATGDLDGDGDQDLLVSTLGGPALVLRNDSPIRGRWLGLRATAADVGGRSCPGTKFRVLTDTGAIHRTLQPCQSYASTHQDLVHIGLGKATAKLIDVQWPHGDSTVERFQLPMPADPAVPGFVYTLQRGHGVLIESAEAGDWP